MSYQVLARKWRPKNFSELLGQDSARQTLTNGLKQKRIYPALLFTGPRGTGKTSSARILAKSLRCQNSSPHPCEKCEDCLLISSSRHLDVIEIDGASNNGVDAVRDLRDSVSYMPNTGKWKIYIIDEVHMLSNSAFNALLKTLEEPPSHALFIMATTESHKIPQTVLSRCQKIDFQLLSPLVIKQQLEKISRQEKISISQSSLWILAKQAKGSLRDAQSLLDQAITFCGKDLTEDNVRRLLGLSDSLILSDCMKALIDQKESDLILCISRLRQKGIDPNIFLQSLISSFTDLLFLKKNPSNQPPLVQASQEEIELKKKQSEPLSFEELNVFLDILLKGEKEMKLCHDSELILEILLLRLCSAPRIEELAPLAQLPEIKPPENKEKKTATADFTKIQQSAKKEGLDKSAEPPALKNLFEFLDHLKNKDPSLSAMLENFCWEKNKSSCFCFLAPPSFSYLKEKIETQSLSDRLEQELAVFLNLKEKIPVQIEISHSCGPSLREKREQIQKESLIQEVEKNSFINEVKDVFSAKVKSVKRIDKNTD